MMSYKSRQNNLEKFSLSKDIMSLMYINDDLNSHSYEENIPYQLFVTNTGMFPFVKYEKHMAHLNDFIYYNNQSLYTILEEKYGDCKELSTSDYGSPFSFEEIEFRSGDYLSWQWLVEEVNKCNNIVLLLSFLEGTLKEIFDWYCEETKYMSDKKKKVIGKIEYYICAIADCCQFSIHCNLQHEFEIIEKAKEIRNIFVHEWDAYYHEKHFEVLRNELKKFKITLLIDAISKIIGACEKAGIDFGILK